MSRCKSPRLLALRSLFMASLWLGAACDSPQGSNATAEAGKSAAPSSASAQAATSGRSSANPIVVNAAPSASAEPTAKSSAPAKGDPKTVSSLEARAKNGVLSGGEADAYAIVGDTPTVIVIDPGAAPIEPLSYEFATASKETTVMRMDMAMKMDMGQGGVQSLPIPQIEMALEIATAPKKEANGDVGIVGTVTGVKVNPSSDPKQQEVASKMGSALSGIKGMKMTYFVSPKGRSRDTKVEMPDAAPPDAKKMVDQMKQSLESMVAPLPADPVGIGGKWLVVTRVSTGADILQWTTYTLKSRAGKKIELEAVVKQLAASPTMSGGQMPAGFNATITSFASGGTGFTQMDLTKLAPEKGTGDVKSMMSFAAQNQKMSVDTTLKLAFTRK